MSKNTGGLDAMLRKYVEGRRFPAGAVIWIGLNGKTYFQGTYGFAQIIPERVKMRPGTIFDLASLTKPLATAMSVMVLCQEKEIRLGDPASRYLPGFRGRPNGAATVKELLTHTAGLPSWLPLYLLKKSRRTEFLGRARVKRGAVKYSCLDYIILGEIIGAVTGMTLDRFCGSKIFKKLNLANTFFNPVIRSACAATELGNGHEKRKIRQYRGDQNFVNPVPWRNRVLRGEVHDGNSFYAYGGIAGNAGLFSNASDLSKYLTAYSNGAIVDLETVENMVHNHTGWRGRERFGLGWKIDMYPGLLSSRSFGHTGFTGTMIAVDPARRLSVVFLTNSVHPRVRLGKMPLIRRQLIERLVRVLG